MRVLILATTVLAILAGADAATAGPSTGNREASIEPAAVSTTQPAEDPISPDKTTRRGVPDQVHHRGGAHHHRIGGPIGLVGGMVAGLFGRR